MNDLTAMSEFGTPKSARRICVATCRAGRAPLFQLANWIENERKLLVAELHHYFGDTETAWTKSDSDFAFDKPLAFRRHKEKRRVKTQYSKNVGIGETMSKCLASPSTLFWKLRVWLKGQIVSDVPPELAVCEFDCRKRQCRFDEWAHCEKRLSYLAEKAHSGGASPTNAEQASLKSSCAVRLHRKIVRRKVLRRLRLGTA